MKKVLRKIPFSISILWLPYLFLLRIVPMQKIVLYIFMMLTIHELAHILIARLFHYPIRKIIIYPFGLAAQISYIGYGSLIKETLILAAGPFTHMLQPLLLSFLYQQGVLSLAFYTYLLQINAALLVFNLLPIYPLDGARLLQNFLHCFFPFQTANRICYFGSFCCCFSLCVLLFARVFRCGYCASVYYVNNMSLGKICLVILCVSIIIVCCTQSLIRLFSMSIMTYIGDAIIS